MKKQVNYLNTVFNQDFRTVQLSFKESYFVISDLCLIPEELASRIILIITQEGNVIVDPFYGSGKILNVARELNRNYIWKTDFDHS